MHAVRDGDGIIQIGIRRQYDEIFAAKPRNDVNRPRASAQQVTEGRQRPIPGHVSVRIVDRDSANCQRRRRATLAFQSSWAE